MKTRNEIMVLLVVLGFLFSSCAPGAVFPSQIVSTNSIIPSKSPASNHVPLPKITLTKGDFYFSLDGKPAFIFSRNLAGFNPADFETLLGWAQKGGTILVRVGTDNGAMGGFYGYGYTSAGEIREDWSKNWEHFFDLAEVKGIYVLPFFTGWMNWNTSAPNAWDKNPFNSVNGGPAKNPTEFFRKDSPTQKLYLQWFEKVVTRWQKHKNIAAWEVITEVNNINGITQPDGLYLFDKLVEVIHTADPQQRPISASLADLGKGDWSSLFNNKSLDILDYHPYPYSATLDFGKKLLSDVSRLRTKYKRPIIIGESGINQFLPDSNQGSGKLPNAHIGIEHAIWTEIVSGTMNGRALFWEDSYAMYFSSLGWPYLQKYAEIELPAANFVKGVDFSGFSMLKSTSSSGVWGTAIGNENMVLGWFRDAKCEPPDWNLLPVISKQSVTLTVSGSATNWKVDFYNTKTGTDIIQSITVTRKGNAVTISLPNFTDDIAFKFYPDG